MAHALSTLSMIEDYGLPLILLLGSISTSRRDNSESLNLSSLNKAFEVIRFFKSKTLFLFDLMLSIVSIESGFGAEDLPDWGGRHFRLLNKPQIAILSHEGFNSYDVGTSWWSLDHHLGIRHSQLNSSLISYGDLSLIHI